MSDPYKGVKGGRLTFKGGSVASLSKSIDKNNKKKKKKPKSQSTVDDVKVENQNIETAGGGGGDGDGGSGSGGDVYTIDAAKRMKYEELFPVEAKKFGYLDPKSNFKSVEDALDDRVKKKADRYCK